MIYFVQLAHPLVIVFVTFIRIYGVLNTYFAIFLFKIMLFS